MVDEFLVTNETYEASAQRFTALIEEFQVLPYPDIREKVFELLQAVDVIHRAGLERLAAFLRVAGHGELIEGAAEDETIRTLFQLYDLLPGDELAQAEAALETIRPYIHSHGGEVEVLAVEDGIVHLRLSGACHGCAGSAITLKRGIEAALKQGFPGFKAISVHESAPAARSVASARGMAGFVSDAGLEPGDFIPLTPANRAPSNGAPGNGAGPHAPPSTPAQAPPQRPIFLDAARVRQVQPGTRIVVEVERVRVLIANVEGEIYAVRNNCPGSMAPLDLGSFTPPVVVCPWHNEPYDIRTGLRVDGVKEPRLQLLPLAVVDGMIRVAVNVLPEAR